MFGYWYKHMTIENVKEEIKLVDEKRGYDYDDEYCLYVNVQDFLDVLKPYEVKPYEVVEMSTDDEIEEIPFQTWLYEHSDMDRLHCGNSYNWTSPLSHDINYEVYGHDMDSTVYIVIRVHKTGDIRGNYTDEIIVKFDSYDSFIYDTMDYARKFIDLDFDYDGENYKATIRLDWYSDSMDVSVYTENYDDVLDLDGVYLQGENQQELIEEMQKLMSENL